MAPSFGQKVKVDEIPRELQESSSSRQPPSMDEAYPGTVYTSSIESEGLSCSCAGKLQFAVSVSSVYFDSGSMY